MDRAFSTSVLFFYKLPFCLLQQMTENMFQEGLYQVYVKDTSPPTQVTNNETLHNVRIHRWFGTVVNTRLLVIGVRCCFVVLVKTIGCF